MCTKNVHSAYNKVDISGRKGSTSSASPFLRAEGGNDASGILLFCNSTESRSSLKVKFRLQGGDGASGATGKNGYDCTRASKETCYSKGGKCSSSMGYSGSLAQMVRTEEIEARVVMGVILEEQLFFSTCCKE